VNVNAPRTYPELPSITPYFPSAQICPPTAVQLALVSSVGSPEVTVIHQLRRHLFETACAIQRRHIIFKSALSNSVYRVEGEGGYFAFIRHPFAATLPGSKFCELLAKQQRVLTLPAQFFAPSIHESQSPEPVTEEGITPLVTLLKELESWVRVSVANVDDRQIEDVAGRLVDFAAEHAA
jgi:aspartate/methionine/tyrosine aminotransferase